MHKSSVSIYFFLPCEWWRVGSHLAFEFRAFHAVLSYAITLAAFWWRLCARGGNNRRSYVLDVHLSANPFPLRHYLLFASARRNLSTTSSTEATARFGSFVVEKRYFRENLIFRVSFVRTFLPVWFTIMSCKKGIWMRCVCKDDYTFYYLRLPLLRLFFVSVRIELGLIVELCLA